MGFFDCATQFVDWLDGRNPEQQESNTKWKNFMSHSLRAGIFLCLCFFVYAVMGYIYLAVDILLIFASFCPIIGDLLFLIDLTGLSTCISAAITIGTGLSLCYGAFLGTSFLTMFAFWYNGKHIIVAFWILVVAVVLTLLFAPDNYFNSEEMTLSFMILGVLMCWLFSNRWRSCLLAVGTFAMFLVIIPLLLIAEGKLPVDILFNTNTQQYFKSVNHKVVNTQWDFDCRTPEDFYSGIPVYKFSGNPESITQARFGLRVGRVGKVGRSGSKGLGLKEHTSSMHRMMWSKTRLTKVLKAFKVKIPRGIHKALKPARRLAKLVAKPVRKALTPVRNGVHSAVKKMNKSTSRQFRKLKVKLTANVKTLNVNAKASFASSVKSFGKKMWKSGNNALKSFKQHVKYYRLDYKAKRLTAQTTGKNAKVKAKNEFTFNSKKPKRATSSKSKQDHYEKHRNEFKDSEGELKYKSADDYSKGAKNFLNNPPKNTLTKTRPNGDTVRFNEKTGEYASMTDEGKIKTYMHPQSYHPVKAPDGFDPNKFVNAKEYFYGN